MTCQDTYTQLYNNAFWCGHLCFFPGPTGECNVLAVIAFLGCTWMTVRNVSRTRMHQNIRRLPKPATKTSASKPPIESVHKYMEIGQRELIHHGSKIGYCSGLEGVSNLSGAGTAARPLFWSNDSTEWGKKWSCPYVKLKGYETWFKKTMSPSD